MDAYPHLRIDREQPINEKRPKKPPIQKPPDDVPFHGRKLQASLRAAMEAAKQDIGGFDGRPLFKLQVGTLSPEEIEKGFPTVEIVSQEEGGFALVFADNQALDEFEARLTQLAAGGKPKYAGILYALQAFDHWTPEDRKGWALKRDGLPKTEAFLLDIELWPLGRRDEREAMVSAFETWLVLNKITYLDKINVDGLVAYRLRVTPQRANALLHHRDVRTVDLLPQLGLELGVLQLDIQDVPHVPSPPDNAPFLAVLDSGIATGHPLLAPALGDAQGFLAPEHHAHDEAGHGTHVAGIALYGDVEECAQAKSFVPQLRLLSGRILDDKAEADPRFIENIVEEAVRYFHEAYGCRVFNLSYGDLNKPYLGRRIGMLALTLDRLSRELNILFVVPTGNLQDISEAWLRQEYPDYLLREEARLLDPAPALNALTVGSVARWDRGHKAWRWPHDIADQPVAQQDQPSPFTRCGESVKGAIKPDLVAYGGNQAIEQRTGHATERWLGELSTAKGFLEGQLLAEKIGTSFAAPHVAHAAARLLAEIPAATNNLLRALLVANAVIPAASRDLFLGDEDKLAQVVGYGMVDAATLYRSTEEQVILIAESGLINKHNHFYEVPVPDSFYNSGRKSRRREISVALAHCPPVRSTRLDYKASRFLFRLIEADSLDDAVSACDKATRDDVDSITELGGDKFAYGATKRSYGTVQSSTWAIKRARKKKLFVVVTRSDPVWAESFVGEQESYALVIHLGDRENENARLYTEIRAQLQARERIRGRARV
ncbi:MAG TPA: S8 family peptidase [Rhodocyclaceae bacterium]|nr:S8 family peptidase [Rhodocyclaceae bacterium]